MPQNDLTWKISGKILTVLGNSVAMRVRPPVHYSRNLNYSVLLRMAGFNVINLARGGNTIKRACVDIDIYIRTFPDIYILNFGVVDASTREVPKWFFNLYNSSGQYWYNRFARLIYNRGIKKIRKPLVYLRLKRSWVGKRSFSRLYELMVERLLKETNAILIGLPVNVANDRVEKALPGSRKNHRSYNQVMRKLLDRDRCFYLELSDINSNVHYPDGVHFSTEGHKIVAEKIIQYLDLTEKK